jgi:hypothetical protein
MCYVLFYIKTGEKIREYNSESAARVGMRTSNRNAGWHRVSRSWLNGYECEWCTNGATHDYAPYGITEYERWDTRFSPLNSKMPHGNALV